MDPVTRAAFSAHQILNPRKLASSVKELSWVARYTWQLKGARSGHVHRSSKGQSTERRVKKRGNRQQKCVAQRYTGCQAG